MDPEINKEVHALDIRVTRVEERTTAGDRALNVALESLRQWQASANEWRQALNDQRGQFVTLDKVLAIIALAIAVMTIIFKFIK